MERFAIPGVGGILERTVERKRYILIQERCKRDAPKEYGLLEIPTGKVREFESIFTCLRREVKEETGLDVLEIQGEDTTTLNDYDRYRVLNFAPFCSAQNLKGEYPIMVQIFICKVTGTLTDHTDETQNLRWISLTELQQKLDAEEDRFYPMHVATLKKYLALYNNGNGK